MCTPMEQAFEKLAGAFSRVSAVGERSLFEEPIVLFFDSPGVTTYPSLGDDRRPRSCE